MVFPLITFLLFGTCSAIWIGEEYWTTVNRDGTLLGGRTVEDFLTFHAVHHNIPMENAYVAFWITYDDYGHYETFGHAYIHGNAVCGRFVDRQSRSRKICGGFRVLSRSNAGGTLGFKFVPAGQADIHQAVEYRNSQIAKIISWQKNEAWYGSARMSERIAGGIDYNDKYVEVVYHNDPLFFNQFVFILVSCSRDDPHAGKPALPYLAFYHTPKEHERIFQLQKQREQQERDREQREQQERDREQREQQWREQQERERREHERELHERQERERQWREQQEREREQRKREREQQEIEREQQESEQQERELRGREEYQEFYPRLQDDEPDEKWKFYHFR